MKGLITSVCRTDEQLHTKMGAGSMFEGTPLGLVFHDKNKSFSLDGDTFNGEIKGGIIASGTNRVTPLFGVMASREKIRPAASALSFPALNDEACRAL